MFMRDDPRRLREARRRSVALLSIRWSFVARARNGTVVVEWTGWEGSRPCECLRRYRDAARGSRAQPGVRVLTAPDGEAGAIATNAVPAEMETGPFGHELSL